MMSKNEKDLIDVTGTPLTPGDPAACLGGDNHPDHPLCCDECDYYLDCYGEDLRDREIFDQAMAEHDANPATYTLDEVLSELGLSHEDLDAQDSENSENS